MIKLSDLIFKPDRPKEYIHNIDQKNFSEKFAKWKKIFPNDHVLSNYWSIAYPEHNYNLVVPVICGITSKNNFHFSFMVDIFNLEISEQIFNYVHRNRKIKSVPKILIDRSFFGQLAHLFSANRTVKFSRNVNIFANRIMCSKKHVVRIYKQHGYILSFN